jgi:hypothetical protein
MIISILDYYMVKIENTLDFCCPDSFDFADQEIIDRQKSLPVQDRPMAWVFFIPALIFLRVLRFSMSVYCILFGKGEVTAQQMQAKIVIFRRYYRSIRHYAVDKWSDEDRKLIEERKEQILWRVYYRIYEIIFMTKPRVEIHYNHDDPKINKPEATETATAPEVSRGSLIVCQFLKDYFFSPQRQMDVARSCLICRTRVTLMTN